MRYLVAFLVALFLSGTVATAADKSSAQPNASEAVFVAKISADLMARFPRAHDAIAAGYIRYTDEDEDGAVSYANLHWTSVDPAHPSQLWYDVHGHLLGADFSVLQADSPQAPSLWGVDPSRWQKFGAHVHYGLKMPDGSTKFGGVGHRVLDKIGGSVDHPSASELVAAGVTNDVHNVRFVFAFPAIWDLIVWVLPNSNGAFADKNPAVTPMHPTPMD